MLLAVALVAAWLVPSAARAASSPLPWVTVSPLPGTPDASPATQISFLGVPAGDISDVVVRGSVSGGHGGRLEAYSTRSGVSYVPVRAFTAGEQVSVSAVETVGGAHRTITTSFTVGSLYKVHWPGPGPVPVPAPGAVQNFVSLPQVHPAVLTVTTPAADPGLGDIFVTPAHGASQDGPMIVSPSGQTIWFSPLPPGLEATDLRVQDYLGQTVLTYWQGRVAIGHGIDGTGVIDNTAYQTIAKVTAGNGLSMDLHDFDVEPDGVAWITIYEPVYANLGAAGGPSLGVIDDCVIQEIDIRTGLVMFEWHALGHVPMSASYVKPSPSSTAVWDWFHVNSIDVEPNQNILISSRNTWTVYQIGHTYGEVLWQLGGRHSSFALGPNVRFAWQHDATMLPDGTIQIFDNEDDPEIEPRSRGIDVSLNPTTHAATLLHQYVDPAQAVLTPSEGDVQQLPNGDQFLGWGSIGLVSEVSPADVLTLGLSFPPMVASYRAYRFPWSARPAAPPAVVATRASGAASTAVAASWNGATGVVSWQVLAGAAPGALAPVGAPVASAGFETTTTAATSAQYVAVEAIGAGGTVLSTSPVVAVGAPAA